MTPTSRQLFFKCFWWALIGSALFVGLFLFVISTGSFFRVSVGGGALVSGILYASVLGNLAGAGLVGWRVVEKYYHARMRYWARRYLILGVITIAAAFLVLLSYNVAGVLLLLGGPLAAWFVVLAISDRPLYQLR